MSDQAFSSKPAKALLPAQPTAEQIFQIEAALMFAQATGHRPAIRMRRFFARGLYARELFLPAGTVLVSEQTGIEHLAVFDGDMTFWGEGSMTRVTGHHVLRTGDRGMKRVGQVHVDSYMTGYFPNPHNELDFRMLEARLFAGTTGAQ